MAKMLSVSLSLVYSDCNFLQGTCLVGAGSAHGLSMLFGLSGKCINYEHRRVLLTRWLAFLNDEGSRIEPRLKETVQVMVSYIML